MLRSWNMQKESMQFSDLNERRIDIIFYLDRFQIMVLTY